MSAGYRPPPSTKKPLPDATIPDLPPTASQRAAAATAPAAAPAVAPAAAPAAAPVMTAEQQKIKMMQDAAAALKAKQSADDKMLQDYLNKPMMPAASEPVMTVKPPGGSGAPK